ncbi:MAG: hypothetical protein EOM70_05500 [Clostridia bacterium]|nr:hypothetical protein [Clostridia bacterium]
MNWTTPAEIKAYVMKLWDRGSLLAALARGEDFTPVKVPLKGPTSSELSERFSEVRSWIGKLSGSKTHYRIAWRQVNHRIIGSNEIPFEIWIDTLDDALALIGKAREKELFSDMLTLTVKQQPELLPWLAKRPLRGLELAEEWPRLLAFIAWLQQHPRPGIYLRQIDLPGIHTKWIEGFRSVLGELLDLVLDPEHIAPQFTGTTGFCRRYGFLDKPLFVRFRLLDSALSWIPVDADQDLTVTADIFAQLDLPARTVFMTENEINFLAFPAVSDAMVIFGAGYGFDAIKDARWLCDRTFYYWGDLDTHGFAILNQLRGVFPHVQSFLMDEQTLLAYRPLWGREDRPETRPLARLTDAENSVYDQLRQNLRGEHVRLEQERIGFGWIRQAIEERM